MNTTAPKVAQFPTDAKARAERKLQAMWAAEDELVAKLRELRASIVPVQRGVSLGRGYLFTVGREALERALKGECRG